MQVCKVNITILVKKNFFFLNQIESWIYCGPTRNKSIFLREVDFWLDSFLPASLQLQCDQEQITAHIGGDFILICKYDTRQFLYSKKYWCQGDSRSTCQILVDSEGRAKTKNTHRSEIIDARRRGLFVKVSGLQFDDTGVFWVGIDKAYADIMTRVKVVITEGKNKTVCTFNSSSWTNSNVLLVSLCQFQYLNPYFGPWALWWTRQHAGGSQWQYAVVVKMALLSITPGITTLTTVTSCFTTRQTYTYTVAQWMRTAITTVLLLMT